MPGFCALRRAVLALAVGLAGAVTILASSASATPPEVTPDHKWMYPNQFRSIDVLANDSDPDGDELSICRIQLDPDDADHATETDGHRILVWTADDPGEDIVIHYWVCDFETLVPVTLTISFRELHEIEVEKLNRPGLLRVTNDNDRVVHFLYAKDRPRRYTSHARVLAHDSVVVRVHLRTVDWVAYFSQGGHILVGAGRVRGIELPNRR